MATVTDFLKTASRKQGLRPFDVRRDLRAVADLVEASFQETIDADGHRYLQQMREASQNQGFLRWAGSMVDSASLPLSGYVWEEDNTLVGNLSLIPFMVKGRRRYLVANVAVHTAYRKQGIGRGLTAAAVEHARKRQAESVWLHVREDNEGAIRLYQSLGFVEQTRRTTWHAIVPPPEARDNLSYSPYRVQSRRSEDWPQQLDWLSKTYPPDLAWHIPITPSILQPGLLGGMQRLFSNTQIRQYSVYRDGQLKAVASWKRASTYTDSIWLAAPLEPEENAIGALLLHTRRHVPSQLVLAIDTPARLARAAIQSAGFREHQTLIWMRLGLK